jgi:signal transduction histidine kinase
MRSFTPDYSLMYNGAMFNEEIPMQSELALRTIYAIISQSSEARDLSDILDFSLDKIILVTQAYASSIHVFDRHKCIAQLIAGRGLQAEEFDLLKEISLRREVFHMQKADPIEGWKDIVVPGEIGRVVRKLGVKKGFCWLMHSKGQSIGILSVYASKPLSPLERQITFISAVADHLGVLIESARLRNQVEETAIIQERQRIARELHDAVTQSLFSLSLYAKGWRRMADNATLDEIKIWLDRLSTIASQTLKEMRLLLYELRPSLLEHDGLVGALQRRLDSVENKVNINTQLFVEGVTKLPAVVEQELYRIAQEALNNALKYSNASQVNLSLRDKNGLVELEIFDDGIGFEPNENLNLGMGLPNMKERVKKMGGSFQIISHSGEGTLVRVRVKL